MNLYLSRIHFPVTTLGPGRRIGIWFQGCSIRCKGCVSLDTWATEKGGVSIDEVISVTSPWLESADGITISGGEPFDQFESLKYLLSEIRNRSKIDILIYTGYSFEKIASSLMHLEGLIDALISDPYDESASQTLVLRGSDNQRLNFLTALGERIFRQFDRQLKESDKTFDIMLEDDGVIWLAGIPRRNDMKRLKAVLAKEGHIAVTTQDQRTIQDEVIT